MKLESTGGFAPMILLPYKWLKIGNMFSRNIFIFVQVQKCQKVRRRYLFSLPEHKCGEGKAIGRLLVESQRTSKEEDHPRR